MDFNNFNSYITLTNREIPSNNLEILKVNKTNFEIEIPKENFKFENISNFFMESTCDVLESSKTNKGKNLKQEKLLGFINNIKINLKGGIEYALDSSEINVLFYQNCIADSILTSDAIESTIKPYFHLNFIYIYIQNEVSLNISLIYTIYLK